MLDFLESSVLVFLVLAAVFEIAERVRPSRRVDRRRDLVIDVSSFALAIALNRSLERSITGLFVEHAPERLIAAFASIRALPSAAKIALALLAVDLCIYWIHRAQHRFDLLWRTHAWHHSTRELWWFSGFRTSFLHSLLYNVPQTAIPILFFGLGTFEFAIGFAIGLFVQLWEHTSWKVDIGPLRHVFVTPDFHRVHHSVTPNPLKNIGTTFSFWDRMFGTYVDPATVPQDTPLGLGEDIDARRVPRMLVGV